VLCGFGETLATAVLLQQRFAYEQLQQAPIISTGDEIEIIGGGVTLKTVCTGVEMFKKSLNRGEAGDNIGALVRGTKREECHRGQILCAPGSVKQVKRSSRHRCTS
jgi:translation elongation factor EF-Tu-like GTPase